MERRPLDSPWQTLQHFADYRGRSTRSELLYFALLMAVAGYALSFLTSGTRYAGNETLRILFLTVFLVPMIALLVRRLHDQARNGWWLLAGLPALALALIQISQPQGRFDESLSERLAGPLGIVGGLSFLTILVLALLPEDKETNRYGPNPRSGEPGEAG